jgi:hypothetical protein
LDEKVKPVKMALKRINIEQAAREAGVPASTLRYDLQKLEAALPQVLANQRAGPKLPDPASPVSTLNPAPQEASVCAKCGGEVRKNGTYWVLNWLLMLTMGWLGIQKVLIQRRRCKECGHEVVSPERKRAKRGGNKWLV